MSEKAFYCIEGHLPKLELRMATERLLLSWENITCVKASTDCLTISFESEFGHIQLSATESLRELFESFQMENLRMIDGEKLHCRIIRVEK